MCTSEHTYACTLLTHVSKVSVQANQAILLTITRALASKQYCLQYLLHVMSTLESSLYKNCAIFSLNYCTAKGLEVENVIYIKGFILRLLF